MLILNYDKSNEGREDKTLVERLLAEIEGVSIWALDGYARLEKQGKFTMPDVMKTKLNEFRRKSSHLFAFM